MALFFQSHSAKGKLRSLIIRPLCNVFREKKGRKYHMKYIPLHRQRKSTSGPSITAAGRSNRLNFYQEDTQRSFIVFQTQTSQKHYVRLFKKNLQLSPAYLHINTHTVQSYTHIQAYRGILIT